MGEPSSWWPTSQVRWRYSAVRPGLDQVGRARSRSANPAFGGLWHPKRGGAQRTNLVKLGRESRDDCPLIGDERTSMEALLRRCAAVLTPPRGVRLGLVVTVRRTHLGVYRKPPASSILHMRDQPVRPGHRGVYLGDLPIRNRSRTERAVGGSCVRRAAFRVHRIAGGRRRWLGSMVASTRPDRTSPGVPATGAGRQGRSTPDGCHRKVLAEPSASDNHRWPAPPKEMGPAFLKGVVVLSSCCRGCSSHRSANGCCRSSRRRRSRERP